MLRIARHVSAAAHNTQPRRRPMRLRLREPTPRPTDTTAPLRTAEPITVQRRRCPDSRGPQRRAARRPAGPTRKDVTTEGHDVRRVDRCTRERQPRMTTGGADYSATRIALHEDRRSACREAQRTKLRGDPPRARSAAGGASPLSVRLGRTMVMRPCCTEDKRGAIQPPKRAMNGIADTPSMGTPIWSEASLY